MKNRGFFWAAFLLVSSSLFAQRTTGSIFGVVKDSTASVLPGVTVTITNLLSGLQQAVVTDDQGNYRVLHLPPGDYQVAAELSGFKRQVKTGITLQIEEQAPLDFVLQVGDVSEEIKVTAQVASPLRTEDPSVGSVVDDVQTVELPLNGRSFTQLAVIVPGAFNPAQGSTLSFRGGFNVGGQVETANGFFYNGIDNVDSGINGPSAQLNVDEVKEFRIQVGTYKAEFGRYSGGQINVITRSGTNDFHGTGFEFLRNDDLDSRNFFDLPRKQVRGGLPEFRRNQFGGTFGGPIVKDKTFFFISYEGLRRFQGITRAGSVPSLAFRQGDFGTLFPNQIIDPITGKPFPNNVIPPDRIDPIAKKLLQFFPLPNRPGRGQNFSANLGEIEDNNKFSARVDHTFSPTNLIFASYTFFRSTGQSVNAFCGSPSLPDLGCNELIKTQVLAIGDTNQFSPNFILDLRFGYNRIRQLRAPIESKFGNVDKELGIRGTKADIDEQVGQGLPAIEITGLSPLKSSFFLPQDRADNTFNFIGNATYLKGNHVLKFGADGKAFQSNFLGSAFGRGRFQFVNAFSGNNFADFLLGLPSRAFRIIGPGNNFIRARSLDLYIQDDWKLTPRLTLNYGLRYELNLPFREIQGRLSSFNPETGMAEVVNNPDSSLIDTDANNFAPRLGFAYDLTGDRQTILRGGYGIFYNILGAGNGILEFTGLSNVPFARVGLFLANPQNLLTLGNAFPEGRGFSPLSPNGIERNFRTGYIQQWSLGVERRLPGNIVLEALYLGNKGTKLGRQVNLNQGLPDPNNPTAPLSARRPYPQIGNVIFKMADGNSNYHSLLLRVEKAWSKGFSLLSSWNISKAIDDNVGIESSADAVPRTLMDRSRKFLDRGRSDFDARQRVNINFVWQVPRLEFASSQSLLDKILNGWEATGIITLQTGRPFTPTISFDNANSGNAGIDRPNLIGPLATFTNPDCAILSSGNPDCSPRQAIFAIPPRGTFGNAGRNILDGPGSANVDLGFFKNLAFSDVYKSFKVQFRAEFFNIFNRTNFDLPNANVDSPNFGRIFTAASSRQIQFGLKILF